MKVTSVNILSRDSDTRLDNLLFMNWLNIIWGDQLIIEYHVKMGSYNGPCDCHHIIIVKEYLCFKDKPRFRKLADVLNICTWLSLIRGPRAFFACVISVYLCLV